MSVDLPDPDGPMIAVNSPPGKSADTPASAVTSVSPEPYTFFRSTACAAAGASPARGPVVVTKPLPSVWSSQTVCDSSCVFAEPPSGRLATTDLHLSRSPYVPGGSRYIRYPPESPRGLPRSQR